MPSRITVESYHPASGEYWTNRYFTTDAWTAAGTTMDALVAAHRGLLYETALITKVRVDDNVPNTNNYDTVAKNQFGTLAVGSQNILPLWYTLRIDFDVAGGGSPSRKYMRCAIGEASVDFLTISGPMVAIMDTFANAVVAIGTICDPQGNLFVDGVPYPIPQQRQLRRGSKKKVTP